MATKIKRSLYVGLGGTGMNALLHTKKMFIETYGEVPPMIGFLGLDTDGGAYKKTLPTMSGEEVVLAPNEQLPIPVKEARPIYEVNKDRMTWIPEQNLYALTSMTLGAGQIRSNGRFAFTVNYVKVQERVRTVLDQITNARIVDNDKYELLNETPEIHMVFSVCGGTGCGTFLNMAYLLKTEAPECKLTGYAVLPDIFKTMARTGMAKVAPNAYGAIMDLDYMMHMGLGSRAFKLDYLNESIDIQTRPFNSVVFIDNKNENGDTYTHIDDLTEMISLALVTSAGELSTASASVSDNLEKNINEGTMDIGTKRAWAAGMGVCEILYRNSDIAHIYAIKAAKILIDRLFNACEDTDTIVNAWIDSPEVNIRENNNSDHVIDYIMSKTPRYELTIHQNANPMPEVEQNIQMNKEKDEVINAKVTELTTRVSKELHNLIKLHINRECGIASATGIIEGLTAQVNIFLEEMRKEKEDLETREPAFRSNVENMAADLKEYNGHLLKSKSKLQDKADDVADATRQLVVCQREIMRRDAAIKVFNNILSMLLEADQKVKVIADNLRSVSKKFQTDLARIQNHVRSESHIFQIDLAQTLATNITVNTDEIQAAEFVRTLKNKDQIFGLDKFDAQEVEKMLLNYTNQLHTTQVQLSTTIDEVIDRMPKEEFERLIDLAIKKSLPLFRYTYRGFTPKEHPHDSYYIGVNDKQRSRLFKDNCFKSHIPDNADCDFANIGQNDKIIVYRQIGVVPVYTINAIETYRNEYEDCNANCHIDNNLLTRMTREEFSIMPKKVSDDDLLELWVKGFIFGLIKNENGMYKFQSESEGDPLDDNWVELSPYRDEAFDLFRRHKASVRKEFTDFINNRTKRDGADAIQSLLEKVKADYYNLFSQIGMDKDEVRRHGFEKIKELITQEISIAKKLKI